MKAVIKLILFTSITFGAACKKPGFLRCEDLQDEIIILTEKVSQLKILIEDQRQIEILKGWDCECD